jgi:hypothetical protein
MRTSSGGTEKTFSCDFCRRKFARLEHLQRHRRTRKEKCYGYGVLKIINSDCRVEDTKEKPFACSCGRSFTRADLLKRHDLLSHAGQPSPPITPTIGLTRQVDLRESRDPEEPPRFIRSSLQSLHAEVDNTRVERTDSQAAPADRGHRGDGYQNPAYFSNTNVTPLQSHQFAADDPSLLDSTLLPQYHQHDQYDPLQDFTNFIDNVGLTLDSNGSNIFNFPYSSDLVDLNSYGSTSTALVPGPVGDSVMVDNSAPAAAPSGADHPGLRLLIHWSSLSLTST